MKGESLYKISVLMGNSPEICRRHYAALLPESLFQSVEFDNDDDEYNADGVVAKLIQNVAEARPHPELRLLPSA